jgi:hypothetical protein
VDMSSEGIGPKFEQLSSLVSKAMTQVVNERETMDQTILSVDHLPSSKVISVRMFQGAIETARGRCVTKLLLSDHSISTSRAEYPSPWFGLVT